jgi:hypothetical protein
MITNGISFGISDLVTLDAQFVYNGRNIYTTAIYVGGAPGNIVYINSAGDAQWIQNAALGYHPIAAASIVTSAIVNGTLRTTTATGMQYCASVQY